MASTIINTNHFDSLITQTVAYDATDPDANIEAAIAMINGSEGEGQG